MLIKYSPEVDILIIKLNDNSVYESEYFEKQGVVVVYDENDNIVGLEIFGWSKREKIDLLFVGKLMPVEY